MSRIPQNATNARRVRWITRDTKIKHNKKHHIYKQFTNNRKDSLELCTEETREATTGNHETMEGKNAINTTTNRMPATNTNQSKRLEMGRKHWTQ